MIGIELCPEAVEDAKFNADSNGTYELNGTNLMVRTFNRSISSPGISNVEYHCGKAEDVIVKTTTALDEEKSQVLAILDPPRAGCRTYQIHHCGLFSYVE